MTQSLPRAKLLAASACLFAAALGAPERAAADAGPPFITNDPGTPGNGHWEINIAAMQTTVPDESVWQLPQLDVNYGLGERIQLTFEVPYVVVNQTGQPRRADGVAPIWA